MASKKITEIFDKIEFFKRKIFTKKSLFFNITSSTFFSIYKSYDFKMMLFIITEQNLVKLDIQLHKKFEKKI